MSRILWRNNTVTTTTPVPHEEVETELAAVNAQIDLLLDRVKTLTRRVERHGVAPPKSALELAYELKQQLEPKPHSWGLGGYSLSGFASPEVRATLDRLITRLEDNAPTQD